MGIAPHLADRQSYLAISAEDLATAKALWPEIVGPMDKVLNLFYAHVAKVPELAPLLDGVDISRVKKAQLSHWEHLFTQGPDASYEAVATRIGTTHERGWTSNGSMALTA